MAEVGVVAIGRNEADRLRSCLQSALRGSGAVVYVDSDSSDRSVEIARALGVSVVVLDRSALGPSRARNEGVARLLQIDPEVKFVQFVDGDCELADDWIEVGINYLRSAPEVAVICGRLRERSPGASIYNLLCDIEWDQPPGESLACGGICMMRLSAFQQIGGFNPDVFAGEEPELCLRLRNQGWKIRRIDSPMAVHDAAMTRLGQWWRRSVRTGYAYAHGASLHGSSPARHYVRETRRAWLWGFLIPAVSLAAAWPSAGFSLLLLLLYPVHFWRMYRQGRARQLPSKHAAAYATSCIAGKFAEIYGLWKFSLKELRNGPTKLIEHR